MVKFTSFLVQYLYVINAWFKFEDNIQNTSKVIMFIRNHIDDGKDNGTKNNMSPPVGGGVVET